MVNMIFDYCRPKLSLDNFFTFVQKVEQDFVPPFLERLDIVSFYNKINKLANIVGCYHKNELIGLCIFYANNLNTKKAYINFIAIDRNFRGRNIAGEILKIVFTSAKEAGMNTVGIHTNNIIAKECYIKNGFILKDSFFEEKYNVIRYYLEKTL